MVSGICDFLFMNDIIELSHLEKAWKKNEKDKSVISYEYAFGLNQI
jgi:hypothetical protein